MGLHRFCVNSLTPFAKGHCSYGRSGTPTPLRQSPETAGFILLSNPPSMQLVFLDSLYKYVEFTQYTHMLTRVHMHTQR